MDETDAAAAQSGENESDPDLDLCPPASPVGNTFWYQWGECFARDRSKTGLRLLFWLCRAGGESSLSVERLHVDLLLSRSTCHCLHPFSFSYLFWTALRDFLDMTKRPLSVSPSNKWVEIFCFSPLALLFHVDGSFIHHCLYFFYKFSQFRAAIE